MKLRRIDPDVDFESQAERAYAELNKKTRTCLTAVHPLEFSSLNDTGCYHRVCEDKHFMRMKREYERLGHVPDSWIARGNWPGIWAALFEPGNTFSTGTLKNIARLRFEDGFFLYDSANPEDTKLWADWQGKETPNPRANLPDQTGMPLATKLLLYQQMDDSLVHLPHHAGFYREHKFGAAIGYSDYVSVVVLDPKCIKEVEF